MMEYLYFIVIALIILLWLDHTLKTKVYSKCLHAFCSKKIYFWIVILILFFIFENIAINRWLLVYPNKIAGIYLGFKVPIEELLFVISWIFLVLVPWEYFKKFLR